MAVDRSTAVSLGRKLQELAGDLSEGELQALSDLLETAHAAASRLQATSPSGGDELAGDADLSVLDEINRARAQAAESGGERVTPAATPWLPLTTTVTIVASHPGIGCGGGGGPKGPHGVPQYSPYPTCMGG